MEEEEDEVVGHRSPPLTLTTLRSAPPSALSRYTRADGQITFYKADLSKYDTQAGPPGAGRRARRSGFLR